MVLYTSQAKKVCAMEEGLLAYVCGDFAPPAGAGPGFMAPRVGICAGHQANMAVRLLLGLEQE